MTAPLRSTLPPMPEYIKRLRVDHRGYPVPFFVQWFKDGKPCEPALDATPDFRVIDPRNKVACHNHRLCWVCGKRLGATIAFVIGPMCAVNWTSGEPPSHRDCAVFSAIACPFLTMPKALRRESNLPPTAVMHPSGLERNPGVAMVWVCKDYQLIPGTYSKESPASYLVRMGKPSKVHFYAQGRPATRDEIVESITTGLPHLEEAARAQGPAALEALERQVVTAMKLIPAP
jgi:hypothetical protein